MRIIALIFYITGILFFLGAVLPINDFHMGIAERTLERTGIQRNSIDSADARIDDLLYKVKIAEQKLAEIRSFFSGGADIGMKTEPEKNRLIGKNIYDPILSFTSQIIRGTAFIFSLVLLSFGAIAHLISRNISLRRRVEKLEQTVYNRV